MGSHVNQDRSRCQATGNAKHGICIFLTADTSLASVPAFAKYTTRMITKIAFNNYYDDSGLLSTVIRHCRVSSGVEQCDEAARQIEVRYNVNRTEGPSLSEKQDTITTTGPLGQITWTINWRAITVGGTTPPRYYLRHVEGCGNDVSCGLYRYAPFEATHWSVTTLQLPVGDVGSLGSYSFEYSDNSYKGFGELKSMTAPTGARYEYQYKLENLDCIPRSGPDDISATCPIGRILPITIQ
jgi:hypothetical protein